MQMTNEQVQILQQVALKSLEHEAKTTQRVIEAIPANNTSYKPDEASMCSIDLAKHIAGSELAFLRGCVSGAFDFSESVPDSLKTPSEVSAWYGAEVDKVLADLNGLTPETLAQIIDFRGMMQMPAVLWLNLALHHSIHHRGQLSAHIRAAGGKVPSIYGPTYEDERARKAASAS